MKKKSSTVCTGTHGCIDPTTLKKGDQFSCNLFESMGKECTCVYLGKLNESPIIHEFQPYIVGPGQPPVPMGNMSLMEGRDIGKDIPTAFELTPIKPGMNAWVDQADTSMGSLLDALNELGAMEKTQGQAAYDPSNMMAVFMKHLPTSPKGTT
jgi:hypothetical protein